MQNYDEPAAPLYSVGDKVKFMYPAEYKGPEGYHEHSGQPGIIVRPMSHPEEYENLGDPMYKIKFNDGWVGDIWESEIKLLDQ